MRTLLRAGARSRGSLLLPRVFAAALAVALAACSGGGSDVVTVSGKTVYRGMGIEEAQVEALRWDGRGWARAATTASGYHGTFRLRLEPGTYRLRARGRVGAPGADWLGVWGEGRALVLAGGQGRQDRVVVELRPGRVDSPRAGPGRAP